jgi:restriction endonuclease S subunit
MTALLECYMQEIKLKKTALILSGAVLNRYSRVKDYPNTLKYSYITMNSVEDNRIYPEFFETQQATREVDEKYLLKNGDVVMKLAPPYSAVLIAFNCENLLAPSNFAIIRSMGKLDPGYLSFILNAPHVRNQLRKLVEGSTLAVIKINHLNEVKLKIRDKNEQILYAKLLSLLKMRRELKMRVIELEDKITDSFLREL